MFCWQACWNKTSTPAQQQALLDRTQQRGENYARALHEKNSLNARIPN